MAEAFDIVCRNYRLGPNDLLRVLYQTEWSVPPGSFRLDTLDEISIEFILDPALNVQRVINPDGMITLPGIGDVQAAGLTREELANRIEKAYLDANIFSRDETEEVKKYQLVTVTVNKFYQKVGRLVESLTTLVGGQQARVTVNPDGTIDMPLLKDRILAAGHTVRDVEDSVNRLYRSGPLQHVVCSVALEEAKSRKVYILGQVNNPGAYEIQQPITAIHAIALAGGHITDTADLTSVMLISKNIHGKPIGRRLDLKRIFDIGDMGSAILVKPYDVLYVPKTYIRDVRVFMEQYVATVGEFAQLVDRLTGN
ncbi:MAG: polysaccharide biosynthesis/export family protein [Desulfomonilaceae bacterium]|nr:polysaccharide biosynthesis/export family protein [Desulfomonilaceae bacterium]